MGSTIPGLSPALGFIFQRCKMASTAAANAGDFTDGGGTTGTLDLNTQLPKECMVLGYKANVRTASVGATTLTLECGTSSDADRFSGSNNADMTATGKTISSTFADGAGVAGVDSATTVRLTLTEDSDFGDITDGEFDIWVFFLDLRQVHK